MYRDIFIETDFFVWNSAGWLFERPAQTSVCHRKDKAYNWGIIDMVCCAIRSNNDSGLHNRGETKYHSLSYFESTSEAHAQTITGHLIYLITRKVWFLQEWRAQKLEITKRVHNCPRTESTSSGLRLSKIPKVKLALWTSLRTTKINTKKVSYSNLSKLLISPALGSSRSIKTIFLEIAALQK